MRKIVMMVGLSACSTVLAGGTSSKARTGTRLDTGLVIVPFAVPVAVPVATVRQPSVLYSYRGYAAAYGDAANRVPALPAADPGDAAAIFSRRCAACHTGAAAQGQLALFDDAGRLWDKLPRRRIVESVAAGRMPKPAEAPRLTPGEIDALRRWAEPPRELVY